MNDSRQLHVSRTVDAPVERVFAMLADPDRHPDLDGSGMLRGSRTHTVLTGVGEVFTMEMHHPMLGDYQVDNVVTTYERDRAIGWSPGPTGEQPFGHTYTYMLEPDGDDRTVVSQTYDWSAVTNEQVRPHLPFVSREQLAASLDRLAAAL